MIKKALEAILVATALIWAVAAGPNTEGKIRADLEEEGWQNICLTETEENDEWRFSVDTEIPGERTLIVEGTLVYEDDEVIPESMTAYGVDEDGNSFVVGTWDAEIDDWVYTPEGEEYLHYFG